MQINIKTNFPEVQRKLETMREDIAQRAMRSTVNKTLYQARTRMIRAITAEYNISARVVREGLVVRNASGKSGRYAIVGTLESPSKRGRARNLIHFKAKQTKTGVQVQIRRNGPKKTIRGAFIANRGNQYGGTVFIRSGSRRLPIEVRQTIDVAQMFNAKRVNELVVRFIESKFPEVFANEARFFIDRFNRS